jgi:preprotein translocase subunit SecE
VISPKEACGCVALVIGVTYLVAIVCFVLAQLVLALFSF